MSLKTLPHVMDAWTQADYEGLTTAEIERLYASMWNKMFRIQTQYEQRTIFYWRNRDKVLKHELMRQAAAAGARHEEEDKNCP
jgi:hypothetical protein